LAAEFQRLARDILWELPANSPRQTLLSPYVAGTLTAASTQVGDGEFE